MLPLHDEPMKDGLGGLLCHESDPGQFNYQWKQRREHTSCQRKLSQKATEGNTTDHRQLESAGEVLPNEFSCPEIFTLQVGHIKPTESDCTSESVAS